MAEQKRASSAKNAETARLNLTGKKLEPDTGEMPGQKTKAELNEMLINAIVNNESLDNIQGLAESGAETSKVLRSISKSNSPMARALQGRKVGVLSSSELIIEDTKLHIHIVNSKERAGTMMFLIVYSLLGPSSKDFVSSFRECL